VAAAAALWFEKYKQELPRDWRRVEAVRNALFTSAKLKSDKSHFGNGVLQARSALNVKPVLGLEKSEESNSSWAFLRVLTGLGIVEIPARERMFNLELAQRWLLNEELQKLVPDPTRVVSLKDEKLRLVMQAIIEDEGIDGVAQAHRDEVPDCVRTIRASHKTVETRRSGSSASCDEQPALRRPPYRRLRVMP
jgi:hypothetical protein